MAKTDIKALVTASVTKAKGSKKDDAGTADTILADMTAAGVEVVADLPSATRVGQAVDAGVLRVSRTSGAQCRERAGEWLAMARLLETETAPDQADVDVLAVQLREADGGTGVLTAYQGVLTGYQDLAERLLRSGKVTVKR